MNRRRFVKYLTVGTIGAIAGSVTYHWPREGFFNPCLKGKTPKRLLKHEIIESAWEGIDPSKYRDVHTHLIGTGDSDSGIYLHPSMQDIFSPAQYVRYQFYINASCAEHKDGIDKGYVLKLNDLFAEFPEGVKAMLLAFEYHHNEEGQPDKETSPFHTPNDYANRIAKSNPSRYEWIASIHPYREDCVEVLEKAVADGAKAVKWLPPVMGIDPSSSKCDRFYEAMARLKLPLLTHAGDEHAVDGVDAQAKGNPLLLRRALEHNVRVIIAHCASEGVGVDLDKGKDAHEVPNFQLFTRLMDEQRYEGKLFGEVSAMTQLNRIGPALQTVLVRDDWHHRLLNGSDYPLPGVMPLFSTEGLAAQGYLKESIVQPLAKLRQHNPILYDFALKRHLQWQGKSFSTKIFESRDFFNRS